MKFRVLLVAVITYCPVNLWSQVSDTTPPTLAGLSIQPVEIDVTGSEQSVLVSLHLTDDLAGVAIVQVSFVPVSGFPTVFCQPEAILSRVSGDALDGIYEAQVTFPTLCQSGDWGLEIFTRDNSSNRVYLYPDQLEILGFNATIQVTSAVQVDTSPPVLQSFSILTNPVDASAADADITVIMSMTDTGSGLFSCQVSMKAPTTEQLWLCGGVVSSGTPQTWDFECHRSLGQYAESGSWDLSVYMLDQAGNSTVLTKDDLAGLGFPSQLEVFSNPTDVLPPEVLDISFSPAFIDASEAVTPVVLTVELFDELSGVLSTGFSPSYAAFSSPSGSQEQGGALRLIDGTPQMGTFQSSLLFPQYSEAGTWSLGLWLRDRLGNGAFFTTDDLEDMGLSSRLTVIRPSLVLDGSASDTGGVVTDETFGGRAQLDVPPGVLSGSTGVAIDVFSNPLDLPNPSGFQAPGTYFVNVDLNPEPAYPLPAPGLTMTLPLVSPLPPGSLLSLFWVDPATGNLVESIGVGGLPVTGWVNPDSLSVTFSGIAHFSVVVALIPDSTGSNEVEIDLKPGEDSNSINPRSKGLLPVAILSSAVFDASTVDPLSVTLAGVSVRTKPNGQTHSTLEDVNQDGRLDLLLHFQTFDLQFEVGATQVVLEGTTFSGDAIHGVDSVQIVP